MPRNDACGKIPQCTIPNIGVYYVNEIMNEILESFDDLDLRVEVTRFSEPDIDKATIVCTPNCPSYYSCGCTSRMA